MDYYGKSFGSLRTIRGLYMEIIITEADNTHRSINGGSPWNVPAGHGSANIDNAIAKFEKENYEANERKLQAVRNNEIRSEKPYQPPAGRLGESIPRPS